MASDDRMGYMAVVAVSCGMALVALQLHKRLTSEFMKKVELSIGGKRPKKKVRFADDVVEPARRNTVGGRPSVHA
ncbi:hypothetical protein C4D60_Mb10t02720 [Musa balbisiana]|uniref:Uncharacterized protein n=1 Tax=Musa balbisiana TaxID=52838 RepID=A0A4V4H4J1_MUSBA|nr:hypothetical protein C4D60_Mb10t02720 [Musa balbisiana]